MPAPCLEVVLGSRGCPHDPGETLSVLLPPHFPGSQPQTAELVPLAGTAKGESHLQPLTSSGSSVGPSPSPHTEPPPPTSLLSRNHARLPGRGWGGLPEQPPLLVPPWAILFCI